MKGERASVAAAAGLTGLAVLPVWVARYPPLYDYYHWVFQGYLVSVLLPGSPVARPDLAGLYFLSWVPVPNLAAPLAIGLMATLLDPDLAGRLFLAICAVAFGGGYAFLVRQVQQRASALQLLAFAWSYGYLMYKGYVSTLASLALAMLAIAALERAVAGLEDGLSSRWCLALAGLGVATYLLHLVGWAVFLACLAVHVFDLRRSGRARLSRRLLLTTLPAGFLLFWYAVYRSGSVGAELYTRLGDKGISLLEGLLLFVRTDPLPPPFPLAGANLLAGLALVALIVFGVKRDRVASGSLVVAGALLIAAALLSPLYDIGDMGRPEERVLLPALLLVVAGLEHRRSGVVSWLAASAVIAGILLGHTYEYNLATRYLERMQTAREAAIPPGSQVASFTIWESRWSGGCVSERLPSIGTSSLKWFGLEREIAAAGRGSRLMETSLVHSRLGRYGDHALIVELFEPLDPLGEPPLHIGFVELFGCADELQQAAVGLGAGFTVAAEGPGYLVLRRRPESGFMPVTPGAIGD